VPEEPKFNLLITPDDPLIFDTFSGTISDFKERRSLRGGGKVGIVGSRWILNKDDYTVVSQSTLSIIVGLEVKRGLCETISSGIFNGISSALL